MKKTIYLFGLILSILYSSNVYSQCVSGDCNNGFGKWNYENGIYEGYFKNGKREGKGKTISYGSHVYEGYYINNIPNGKGKILYDNGSVYDGDWVNGRMSGRGVFVWGKGVSEGDRYEGDWVDGLMTGKGTYIWGVENYKGDRYDGDWLNSSRTGFGKLTKNDGTIQEGKWMNNVFQGSELSENKQQNNNQTNSNHSNSTTNNSNSSTSNYIFIKSPELKINYVDNREMCCCCNEKYGQYKLNDKNRLEVTEKILFSIEKLALYHKENGNGMDSPTINKDQIDLDLKKVQEELLKIYPNYSIEISAGSIVLYNLSSVKAKYGAKLCSIERNVNLYENVSNLCSLKCKNKCGSCR